MESKKQTQIEKIASWVEEGRLNEVTRKSRNRALIHLGLSAIEMIKKNELEVADILDKMEPSIQEIVIATLNQEKGIRNGTQL